MAVKVEIDVEGNPDYILVDAEWRYKELCKSLPGAKWDATKQVWRVPLSWTSCLALRSTFKTDLEVGEWLASWASDEAIGPTGRLFVERLWSTSSSL